MTNLSSNTVQQDYFKHLHAMLEQINPTNRFFTTERLSACCNATIDDFGFCTDCKEQA